MLACRMSELEISVGKGVEFRRRRRVAMGVLARREKRGRRGCVVMVLHIEEIIKNGRYVFPSEKGRRGSARP